MAWLIRGDADISKSLVGPSLIFAAMPWSG